MKRKRRKQRSGMSLWKSRIRRRAAFSVLTLFAILSFSMLAGGFIARAQKDPQPLHHKYFTSIQIASGDTLWSIADCYCDENFRSREAFIKEVMRTNHLLDTQLQEGYYLIVPYYSTEREH